MRSFTGYLAAPLLLALALCGCSNLPDETILAPAADISIVELEKLMAQATDPEGR